MPMPQSPITTAPSHINVWLIVSEKSGTAATPSSAASVTAPRRPRRRAEIQRDQEGERLDAARPQQRRVPERDRVIREHERGHQRRALQRGAEQVVLEQPYDRRPL